MWLSVGLLSASARSQTAAPGSFGDHSNRSLIVVSPASFFPALNEFIAHKEKLLPTRLVPLENILRENPGTDDPEKLKRYLYEQWRTNGLGYVLLVGDVDILPVRYMVLDRVTPTAFDYAFYPSDLYYSDLAKPNGSFEDWNGRKDSFHATYFGEVRGEKNKQDPINYDDIDYRPEIAVGRWPVSNADEARLVATKTIAAEDAILVNSNPQLHRAAFVATSGWVDTRSRLDHLASTLTNHWQTESCYYADSGGANGGPPPTHDRIRQLFDGGIGLIVHTGHGQPDGWDQCLSVGDLDRITNSATLPVVISAGCSTAYFAPLPPYEPYLDVSGHEHAGSDHKEVFDSPPPPPSPYQTGKYNPTGLGEQLLKRNGRGAVAYIGCNTGSQPCGVTLAEGFVTALATTREPHLGDCWAKAISYYFDREHLADLKPNSDWYPPSIFFQGMKFMLFGDPSLRLPSNGSPSSP